MMGLLLTPGPTPYAAQVETDEASAPSTPPLYAYSNSLGDLLGEAGKKYTQHFVRVATLFDVPVDVLAASVKIESSFRNLAVAGTGDRAVVGMAQLTLQEWLRAGKSETIRQFGLDNIFTAANFHSTRGGLNPLYNLICHAHSLRSMYQRFLDYSVVGKIPYDASKNPIGWLVALAMYNGGERILSTIYDEKYQAAYARPADRQINWEKVQPDDLIRLLRHGRGYHADWSRNSVANHVWKVVRHLAGEPGPPRLVMVDLEHRTVLGKTPPPQRIYQTLSPGYNE